MKRTTLVTLFWVALTAALVLLEAHSLAKIATPEQVFVATLIFTMMVMTFTLPPIFEVRKQEQDRARR